MSRPELMWPRRTAFPVSEDQSALKLNLPFVTTGRHPPDRGIFVREGSRKGRPRCVRQAHRRNRRRDQWRARYPGVSAGKRQLSWVVRLGERKEQRCSGIRVGAAKSSRAGTIPAAGVCSGRRRHTGAAATDPTDQSQCGLILLLGHAQLPRQRSVKDQPNPLSSISRNTVAHQPKQTCRPSADAIRGLSAPGMIRTCDTGFRRAVLYPLSYGGQRAGSLPGQPGGAVMRFPRYGKSDKTITFRR